MRNTINTAARCLNDIIGRCHVLLYDKKEELI